MIWSCPHAAELEQVFGISRHSVVAAVTLAARDDVGDCVDVTFDPRVDCGSEEERQALRIAVESSLQQGMALVHKYGCAQLLSGPLFRASFGVPSARCDCACSRTDTE